MYQITIQEPHELLNEVAKIYETTPRVFMEYIDNSFDSASDLRKEKEQKTGMSEYPYPIKITILVDPKQKIVKFLDNCEGMDRRRLKGLVTDINKSEKKARPWTNGQFGYGAQAFRACAGLMTVISKMKDKPLYKIEIPRNTKNVNEETEIASKDFLYQSGTLVVLSDFEKQWWDDLSPDILRQEIEKHFEGLLVEKDIEVKLTWGVEEYICKPFNYEAIHGKKIEEEGLSELVVHSRSRRIEPLLPQLNHPIKIYLKITKNIIKDKRPVFMNKGRRIGEIQSVRSFITKSKGKTALWGHPNLIGYIEINDNLKPILIRNDFQKSFNRMGLYNYLVNLEEKIQEELVQVNRIIEESSFGKLEDILSKLLDKMARQDRMRFKEDYKLGEGLIFDEKEAGEIDINMPISLDIPDNGNDGKQIEKGNGIEVIGDLSSEGSIIIKHQNSSGFRVRFNPIDPPVEEDIESGNIKKLRSQYVPKDAIHIYIKHEDFQTRVRKSSSGMKLTFRLASYIASELSIHYKKLFYEKYKLQPQIKAVVDDIKRALSDQTEFIYRLEEALQPYVDKDLSALEAIE